MNNYLCKTKGGVSFVYTTSKDLSKNIGKHTYYSNGGDFFRIISEIKILDYKDVINLNLDYSLVG
jgi:hypothetical protein